MRLFASLSSLFVLLYSTAVEGAILPESPQQLAVTDTVVPTKPRVRPNSVPPRGTKPIILPGTMLDTTFSSLPTQSPAVAKAVPNWLRPTVQGNPLFVIDGKSATANQLRDLRKKDIVSTYQLEGRKAQNMYGKNARNGVFIITTKSGVSPK